MCLLNVAAARPLTLKPCSSPPCFLKSAVSLRKVEEAVNAQKSDMMYIMMALDPCFYFSPPTFKQRLGVVTQKTIALNWFLFSFVFKVVISLGTVCLTKMQEDTLKNWPSFATLPSGSKTVGLKLTAADHTSITSTLFESHLKTWRSEIFSCQYLNIFLTNGVVTSSLVC